MMGIEGVGWQLSLTCIRYLAVHNVVIHQPLIRLELEGLKIDAESLL